MYSQSVTFSQKPVANSGVINAAALREVTAPKQRDTFSSASALPNPAMISMISSLAQPQYTQVSHLEVDLSRMDLSHLTAAHADLAGAPPPPPPRKNKGGTSQSTSGGGSSGNSGDAGSAPSSATETQRRKDRSWCLDLCACSCSGGGTCDSCGT